ncbi:MAG: DUF4253 domain-containing protein [Actinomycetaceae bacterium]|nr:DUF4253 domain-containing protein [Actinomycetaceae bacterium]
MTFSAPRRGALPPEGPLTIAGITLPAGVHIYGKEGENPDQPVAWFTSGPFDDPIDIMDAVHTLAAHFPETGLWPLTVTGLDDSLERPWLDGELLGAWQPSDHSFNAEEYLLSEMDPDILEEDPEYAEYYAGLTPINEVKALHPEVSAPFPAADELYIPWNPETQQIGILLVPATSPADALEPLGWLGPTNHGLEGIGIAQVAKSWEERFHLTVLGASFDVLCFQFPEGGLDRDALVALCAEIYKACPDDYDQNNYTNPQEYIDQKASAPLFRLWWD